MASTEMDYMNIGGGDCVYNYVSDSNFQYNYRLGNGIQIEYGKKPIDRAVGLNETSIVYLREFVRPPVTNADYHTSIPDKWVPYVKGGTSTGTVIGLNNLSGSAAASSNMGYLTVGSWL